jgi:hypothetical protein
MHKLASLDHRLAAFAVLVIQIGMIEFPALSI